MDSAAAAATGVLLSVDATFAAVPRTAGLALCGGAGEAGTGCTGGAAGVRGSSLLIVVTVVTFTGLATGGAGASCRLSDGSGDSEAACNVPGWTITVFTAIGLIGSVEPGIGASVATGAADAMRTGAEPVRSSALPSLRTCT